MTRTTFAILLCCAALGGCATLPADRGRDATTALLEARGMPGSHLANPEAAAALLAEVGDRPLELGDAVRVALVGNPGLRARFAELGFASAEVYDAGRLSNPRLDLGYLFVDRGSAQNERIVGVAQNFTELVMLPARKRLAATELTRVQHAVAGAVQALAGDVAYAWYTLAGATESAAVVHEAVHSRL